jgi:transcriptional regulator with XRE-family HTH domain
MLSQTLDDGLKAYGIGPKIRSLRLKKSMGLVALSGHTGLSPALLSKIERGRLYPTLPTLLRIALVFSVGLDYFIEGSREKPALAVVRKKDRLRLPDTPDGEASYTFESLDFPVSERRVSAATSGKATHPPACGRGTHLCLERVARGTGGRRGTCAGDRRFDVLRFERASRLPASRSTSVWSGGCVLVVIAAGAAGRW